jgi:hypothetical protein
MIQRGSKNKYRFHMLVSALAMAGLKKLARSKKQKLSNTPCNSEDQAHMKVLIGGTPTAEA